MLRARVLCRGDTDGFVDEVHEMWGVERDALKSHGGWRIPDRNDVDRGFPARNGVLVRRCAERPSEGRRLDSFSRVRWIVTLALGFGPGPIAAQALPVVHIETTLGTIVVEVDTVRAPITATNFLRYLDSGLYDGGRFYRTVTLANQPDNDVLIEVIQGGIDPIVRDRRYHSGRTSARHVPWMQKRKRT